MSEVIGAKLKAMREAKLMTLLDVSLKCQVHASTIAKIEAGKTEHMRFSTVKKLAKAFDMDPHAFAEAIGLVQGEEPVVK